MPKRKIYIVVYHEHREGNYIYSVHTGVKGAQISKGRHEKEFGSDETGEWKILEFPLTGSLPS